VPVFESPELVDLFRTYTASAGSIAAHFAAVAAEATAHDPLIVATGTDICVYRGHGLPPAVQGIRTGTRGFKELAGISHLGPAVATVVLLNQLAPQGTWRDDARRLLDACRSARTANSVSLWEREIAVPAFAGREASIAALVDYSCRLTERYLRTGIADPEYLTPKTLRADYLEDALPVPFNRVMIATFFLTGMDIAHRLIAWFDELALPWERAMVMMVGRTGKPTGAVTRETHSIAGIIEDAARGRLPVGNLLIAPHAPVFDGADAAQIAASEERYRQLYTGLTAVADLGPVMFDGYPRFQPRPRDESPLDPRWESVSEMPVINSPGDWHAMTTRLRLVLEDPKQLLSSAVTDYASRQLIHHDNMPAAVTVPGLDGESYPSVD
jgi:Domain of unknown function (DUF5624)